LRRIAEMAISRANAEGTMRLTIPVACLGLLAGISPALAVKCDDSSNQGELNICADQEYEAADSAMNGVYQQVLKRLAGWPENKARLIAAQKAWIGFRDAECDFQTAWASDGTIYPLLVSQCLTDMTKKRSAGLDVYMHCEDGDTLCPVPAPVE
jgi:uncharacterized protein YecT (DUF1311 family)